MLRVVASFLTSAAATPAESVTAGLKLAIAQRGLDSARDFAMPLLADALDHLNLPSPLVSGDDLLISWSVGDVVLSDVGLNATVNLQDPNLLSVDVDVKSLKATAKVHAREDLWPHPSGSCKAHVKVKKGTAAIIASVDVNNETQMAFVGINSCTPHIKLGITITGLLILDPIVDIVIDAFKGILQKEIGKAICKSTLEGIGMLNSFLTDFSYQQPLPDSIGGEVIDYHLTSSPAAVAGPPRYLQIPVGGEVLSKNGSHAPVDAPVLPALLDTEMGSHMLTLQISPFPVNTALYTTWQAGVLQVDVPKDSAGPFATYLSTAYWAKSLPELAARFPEDTDMLLRIGFGAAPDFALASGQATVTAMLSLNFVALPPDGEVPVFVLGTPFDADANVFLSDDNSTIQASLDHLGKLKLAVESCEFGHLDPKILFLLNPVINTLLQTTIVPLVNKVLAKGFVIPTIANENASLSFPDPVLSVADGYILVGTDFHIDLNTTHDSASVVIV